MVGRVEDPSLTRRTLQEKCNFIALLIIKLSAMRQKGYLNIHLEPAAAKSLQLCPTLCGPTDGSPSGSPIPRILQPGTLEWVAISFSNA